MPLIESLAPLVILFVGCFALVIWGGSRNDRFLYLAGFLIPFQSIRLQSFIGLTWMQLIFPLSITAIVVHKKHFRRRDIEGRRWLVLYFVYAFYLTSIRALLDSTSSSPLSLQAAAYGWGPAQSTYRYPVQLLSFIFTWGVLFTGFWFTRERRDVVALIKGYIDACMLNALVGFYLLLAYRWHLPWPAWVLNPGGDLADTARRMLVSGLGRSVILHRLTGFGGEPKNVAGSLVLAMVLILCLELFSGPDNPVRHGKLKVSVMMLALFFTFSSSGWLSFFCVGAYLLVTSLLHGKSQVLGYILLVLLILGVVTQFYGVFPVLQDLYEARIVQRLSGGLESLSLYEPRDTAAIRYLLQNPLDMVLGQGTGGIDFRIMTDSYLARWVSERDSTVTPSLLLTRQVGDLGLVGLVLSILLWWQWSKKLKEAGLLAYRQFLIAGVLAQALVSLASLTGYLLLCSSMVAYACRDERLNAGTRE